MVIKSNDSKYMHRRKFKLPKSETTRAYRRPGDKRPCDFLLPCDWRELDDQDYQ